MKRFITLIAVAIIAMAFFALGPPAATASPPAQPEITASGPSNPDVTVQGTVLEVQVTSEVRAATTPAISGTYRVADVCEPGDALTRLRPSGRNPHLTSMHTLNGAGNSSG